MEYQNSQPAADPAAGPGPESGLVPGPDSGLVPGPAAGPVARPGDGLHAHVATPPLTAPAGSGRTVISEAAVAKVAGIAARSVPGVYSLGTGPSRALGAIRDAVGSADHAAGVRVEVGETQVAVDIDLVAVYGAALHALAEQIRAAVYAAVEELVGLEVIEVNIEINDVYVPGAAKTAASGDVRPAKEAIQ